MTAYDVVFSKDASARYMQKEAGLGSIITGTVKGIQRARRQRAIAKEWKKMQKFKARQADLVSQANAARAASDATLNAAVAKSGGSNLWGNIKGSHQAEKAKYLQVLAKDAEKAFIRRQMAIEKLLVAQGATKEQARAITRNVNAQKYLQHGDADGAMKLQAVRDRRLQAVADGRARQQAAQAAAQAAPQPAAQAANNALNGGGGFQVTFSNAPGAIMPVQQTAQTVQPATQAAAAQAAVQAAAKAVAANRARQRAAQAAAQAAAKATKPTAKATKPTAKAAKPAAAQATQPAAQAANNALNRVGGFAVTLHQ